MAVADPLDRAPDAGSSLRRYASALWRRRWLVALLLALGALGGWWQGQRSPDVYVVTTRIDIAKQRPFGISASGGTGVISFGEGYYESSVYYPTRYALLSSRTYAERLLRSKTAGGKTVYPMWDWLTWPAYRGQRPEEDLEEKLGKEVRASEFEALVGVPPAEFRRRFSFRRHGPPGTTDAAARFDDPSDLEGFLSNRVVVRPEKGTTLVGIDLEGEDRLVLAPLLNLLIEVFWREQRSESQIRLENEKTAWEKRRASIEDLADPARPKGLLPAAKEVLDAWKATNLSNANRLELFRSSRANQVVEGDRKIRELDERVTLALPDLDLLVPERAAVAERLRAQRLAAKAAGRAPAEAGKTATLDPAEESEVLDAIDAAVLEALARLQAEAQRLDVATAEARFLPMIFVSTDRDVAAATARLGSPDLAGADAVLQKRRLERVAAIRDVVLRTVRDLRRDIGLRLALRRQREADDRDLQNQWDLSSQLSDLQARYDAAKRDLDHAVEQLGRIDAQMGIESDMKPLKVIEGAVDPDRPLKPNRPLLILIGAAAGLLLGLSLALFLDWLDDTVADPDGVARHVGVPVVGTIVTLPDGGGGTGADRVALDQPRAPAAEAFRAVRTAVEFFGREGGGGRVLLVTSCGPREGKTTVACNLAAVLAQDGKRTLLIDADLRRPRVHQVLRLDGHQGLSNVVVAQARLEDVVRPTEQESLWALPAGAIPPNPAELLGRGATAALLERLRTEYDRIVVDTPPVGVVTDAAVLARHADLVLMVVAAGRTKKVAAEHGVAVLRSAGAEPAGVVLNQVARGARWLYGGYYDREAAEYYASTPGAGGSTRS